MGSITLTRPERDDIFCMQVQAYGNEVMSKWRPMRLLQQELDLTQLLGWRIIAIFKIKYK